MLEYVIAVDAMGGDNAPDAIVRGALDALKRHGDVRIQLYGPADILKERIAGEASLAPRIEIIDAPEIIDMHESPTEAIRRKKDSSMVRALLAVKDGRAQAMVSAGSTGALLAGGILRIGRIEGVERPALTVVMPGRKQPFLLIDGGANVDCRPHVLPQFGLMGAVYMEKVMGVAKPQVCLVNIGAEPEKGNRVYKEAHALMAQQQVYHFGGNIEARDVAEGMCDVVVADGFDGNLLLKYTEGLSATLARILKDELMASTRTKLGALLAKPALAAFKNRFSHDEHGGAPLLGVKGAIIKAHGSSGAMAIMNAIGQARTMIQGDVVRLIADGVGKLAPASE